LSLKGNIVGKSAGKLECSLQADISLSFEDGLGQLDLLIQQLESGRLPLDESLQFYRRGAELLQNCQKQLCAAEEQIKVLEGNVFQLVSVDNVVGSKQASASFSKKIE
jgi:exodeoxyribonuclease VII small subunit